MENERKKVWIDSIQTKLFLRMWMYWLFYQVALWNLVFVWRLLREGAGNPIEQYYRFLCDYAPAIVGCLILLPFLARDTVRYAHKVVGPIFRFRKALQAMASGEAVRPIKLRDDDLLTEMRDEFNQMLETLQRQGVPVLKPADPLSEEQQRQRG